jgi:hypothetical protein
MKVTLALTLTLVACFVAAAPRSNLPANVKERLLVPVTCFEAPSSVTSIFKRFRFRWASCKSTADALREAREHAQDEAFDDIRSPCQDEISAAEAEALCQEQGNFVVARPALDMTIQRTVPRPSGSDNIEDTRRIAATSLCVTFRESAGRLTDRGERVCGFWGNERTFRVRFRALARCGVLCRSLD